MSGKFKDIAVRILNPFMGSKVSSSVDMSADITTSQDLSGKITTEEVITSEIQTPRELYIKNFDLTQLIVVGPLTDSYDVSELISLELGSSYQDYYSSSDSFSRVVDFNRAIGEVNNTSDSILIDSSKVTTSSTSPTDLAELVVAKPLLDVYGSSDAPTINLTKSFSDQVLVVDLLGVTDGITYSFAATDFETQAVSDFSSIEPGKIVSDTYSSSDSFDRVVTYNRLIPDVAPTSDAYAIVSSKQLTDSNTTSDTFIRVVQYDRQLSSQTPPVVTSESVFLNPGKIITDAVTVTDLLGSVVDRSPGDLVESNATSDTNTLLVGKSVSDLYTSTDSTVLLTGKFLTDSYASIDLTALTVTKPFADSFASADSTTIEPGKVEFESVALTDIGSGSTQSYAVNPDYFAEHYTGTTFNI